jgi:hypothetical protein
VREGRGVSDLRTLTTRAQFLELNLGRYSDVGFQYSFHVPQRSLVPLRVFSHNTISRDEEFKVSHVGVIRREEDTNICGDAGED